MEFLAPRAESFLRLPTGLNVRGAAQAADVVGRRITDWTPCAGSYGMGGPGFLAFRVGFLRWLVCTVWAAGERIAIDGRPVEPHAPKAGQVDPAMAWRFHCTLSGGATTEHHRWDHLSPVVAARPVVTAFEAAPERVILGFGEHRLVMDAETMGGLPDGVDLRQHWVIARSPAIRI